MPYWDHERYQTHCSWCHKVLEADSGVEAIVLAEAHEREECPKRPNAAITCTDFEPDDKEVPKCARRAT